jgi:hypothetical protein
MASVKMMTSYPVTSTLDTLRMVVRQFFSLFLYFVIFSNEFKFTTNSFVHKPNILQWLLFPLVLFKPSALCGSNPQLCLVTMACANGCSEKVHSGRPQANSSRFRLAEKYLETIGVP